LDSMGHAPTVAALSSRLGVTEADITEMDQRLNQKDFSLDAPQGDDDGQRWIESHSDSSAVGTDEQLALSEEKQIFAREIKKLLPTFSEKERYLLQYRILGDPPQTLQEVGDNFGITRERARQLEERILVKLKEHFAKVLPDYKINLS